MVDWANRITDYGEESPQALAKMAHPLNWRQHPDYQAEAMEANLDKIGWIDDVIVNKTTGRMIDGHLRVKQALAKGVKSVPVKYVELTEDEEKYALATFDPIAALAEADNEMLAKINEELDEDLSQFFSEDDWAAIAPDETNEADAGGQLSERFGVPPFSVLDARQGYWQDRKRAWLALGIQSELGRGENLQGPSSSNDHYRYSKKDYLSRKDGTLGAIAPNEAGANGILSRTGKYTVKKKGEKTNATPGASTQTDKAGRKKERRVSMAMDNDPMQRKRKYDKS